MFRMTTRLVLVGGYPGSGKTTLIERMAKDLVREGSKVAMASVMPGDDLIGRDRANALSMPPVDILDVRSADLGGEMVGLVQEIMQRDRPDFIFFEVTGTVSGLIPAIKTDISAAVGLGVHLAPAIVVTDALRVDELVDPRTQNGTMRRQQIAEADLTVLSKIDGIVRSSVGVSEDAVRGLNPKASLIQYSAMTGKGKEELLDRIMRSDPVEVRGEKQIIMPGGLSIYTGTFKFSVSADLRDMAAEISSYLSLEYSPERMAHVSVLVRNADSAVLLSAVGESEQTVQLKGPRIGHGDMTASLGACMEMGPEELQLAARKAVQEAVGQKGGSLQGWDDQCHLAERLS